jgi:hypothetical protein
MRKLELIDAAPRPDTDPMPSDLGHDGRLLWERVMREYRIDDVGGLELLRQGCRAADRAEKCRRQIDAEGELVETKHGPKENPLCKIELSNRHFVARVIRALGLDVEPVRASAGRPPSSLA